MSMPVKFSTDTFVDAVVHLVVASGPGAATASAVARAVGAPSGSVYHRFARRSDLLAAAWLRSLRCFQDGYLPVLAADGDPVEVGVAAARQVLQWSVDNREAASLLAQYGREDLVGKDCSPMVHSESVALDTRLQRTLTGYLARFPSDDRDRVLLAVIDGPLALVRRSLRSGGREVCADVVADVARRLLVAPGGATKLRPRQSGL